jgi:uncharacterized protein
MKHHCPICGSPTDSDSNAEFPFCSDLCKTKDLGNWAAERYVISEPAFDEDAVEKIEESLLEDDESQADSPHTSKERGQ